MTDADAQNLDRQPNTARIATFNASLSRDAAGQLLAELEDGTGTQIRNVAETIRRVRPDILLINEFDHDRTGRAYRLFNSAFLESPEIDGAPWPMEPVFSAPSNTGLQTGEDVDGDGSKGGPADAHGFGRFEGQYAMVLYSRFPLAASKPPRTFQSMLWRDLPGARLPDKTPGSGAGDFYPPEAAAALRLSSKNHWDVPIALPDGRTLHILASHPTPPVFDGPEDRNGLRNADEIRFWSLYLEDDVALHDDTGQPGGLPKDAHFAIVGDLNNDPEKGDGLNAAIEALLAHPRVQDPRPASAEGGTDTASFAGGPLRVDYVLPSASLTVQASGVFWPGQDDPGFPLIGPDGRATSDHRLVWVDVILQ